MKVINVSKGTSKDISTEDLTQSKELTDWKNPPKLSELKSDYTAALSETNKQVKKVQEWLDAFNAENDYAPPNITGRSKMVVKLVRKQVEWRCPTLSEPFLSNTKLFQVSPRTAEDIPNAKQHELILNYQFKNKLNSVKLMDDIVRMLTIEGTAIVKTSWDYKADTYIEMENEYQQYQISDPTEVQQYQQLLQQLQQDPTIMQSLDEAQQMTVKAYMQTQQLIGFSVKGQVETTKSKAIRNNPLAEVCDLEDVHIDPSCKGDTAKAKFLVQRFTACLADLREDGRYKKLDTLEADIESHNTASSTATGFQFKDKARKTFDVLEYWGYYDIDGDGILHSIVAAWVGDTLIRMERNPYPDNGIPFTFIPMIPVRGSIYGEPDAELIKENQKIMSATMRGMVDLFGRSANGQTGFAKGFLDAVNLTKFNEGENYYFSPNTPPDRGMYTHKYAEIPASAFNMMQYLTAESEAYSGVRPFSQGAQANSGSVNSGGRGSRTSTDATAIRDNSILRRIAQGMVSMAYKFQTLNAALLTEEDVVRLSNTEFVAVDPDNLSGDFDLNIEISTPEADQAKADDLSFLLQTGQNTFPFEFTQRILAQIAKLKNQPDLEDFITNYKQPPPDPMQQQKMQLELDRMQADIELVRAQAAESMAKAQVHGAEVGVRDKRMDNIQSNTDKTNIDTYRKANGVDQMEKLEQEQERNRGQLSSQDLKHVNDQDNKKLDHTLNLLSEGAKHDIESMKSPETRNNKFKIDNPRGDEDIEY